VFFPDVEYEVLNEMFCYLATVVEGFGQGALPYDFCQGRDAVKALYSERKSAPGR